MDLREFSITLSPKYLTYSSVAPISMYFQEFVQTLDRAMIIKLCIRSLRRHGLHPWALIMEDDLDDDIGSNEESVSPIPGTSTEE